MDEPITQQESSKSGLRFFSASFIVVFLLAFTTTLYTLVSLGAVPEYINGSRIVTDLVSARNYVPIVEASGNSNENSKVATTSTPSLNSEEERILPVQILIDKIGVDSVILNPTSTNIEILDNALLAGAVRYPGSGTLEDDSNMFIFGHSADSTPAVSNEAYKEFDGFGKLDIGDEIRVLSDEEEYIYRITQVSMATAEEALVEFERGVKMLTLSTCNTFGSPEERVVVEAIFVESYPIAMN